MAENEHGTLSPLVGETVSLTPQALAKLERGTLAAPAGATPLPNPPPQGGRGIWWRRRWKVAAVIVVVAVISAAASVGLGLHYIHQLEASLPPLPDPASIATSTIVV